MDQSDSALLAAYAASRDADAFASIVRRHTALVYGTCMRLLRSDADAQDVTQACFFELARNPKAPRAEMDSLAGYLHTLARSRSLDALRSSARRQHHEQAAIPKSNAIGNPTWDDIIPHVDAAIANLRPQLREPLLLNFFEKQTQSAIAEKLGVDQATVSRRIEKAIEIIRAHLARAGVVATAAALIALLGDHATLMAAPAALENSLAKMALAGPHTAPIAPALATQTKWLVATTGALILAVGIYVGYSYRTSEIPPMVATNTQNEKLIDGIPQLVWARSNTTFCGTLAAIAEVTPNKTSYGTLMGQTGLAFRTRWWKGGPTTQRWCPSSPVGEFPEEMRLASRSLGFALTHEWFVPVNDPRRPAMLTRMKEEINAGRPVISYNAKTDCNIIRGYADDGRKMITRDYDHGLDDVVVPSDTPSLSMVFLGEAKTPLDPIQAARAGITLGIRNWTRDGRRDPVSDRKDGAYLFGREAYNQWIADLKEMDTAPAQLRQQMFQPSWWTFISLVDARASAVSYLRSIVSQAPMASQTHLLKASNLYEEMAQKLAMAIDHGMFLGPWSGSTIADWSPQVRAREIELLTAAREADEAAIAELQKALAAMIEPPTLADLEPGHEGYSYVVGVETIQHYLSPEKPVSYARLMGLSGMAFVIQAMPKHEFQGKVDVGWWPMDSWTFHARTEFLGNAIGWKLRRVQEVEEEFRANPTDYYHQHFAPEVRTSLAAGKPVLGDFILAFVITEQQDHGAPQGRCAAGASITPTPPEGEPGYPWGLLIFDHPVEPMNAKAADLEALRYAVALAQDAVPIPYPDHFTGQKAWRAWSDFLRDTDKPTENRHHANMLLHLRIQRAAAANYLRDVASQFEAPAQEHLLKAADLYEGMLPELSNSQVGDVQSDPNLRRRLADMVDQWAAKDAAAIAEIQAALQ